MLGATKPTSRKLTVVLDPFVTAQFLGVLSATLNGESVLKGRSLFAHRVGEQVAAPIVTLVDDATNPLAFSATPLDGEGLATRRTHAHRRRRPAGLRAELLQRAPQRHGVHRQRHPGRLQEHARLRLPGAVAHARHPARRPT